MSYLGRSAKLSLKAQEKVSFLATAGQTVKTGLSYVPSFVEVYVNGVLLTDTTDFTATNGNSITFTVALLLNDEVTVISLKTFTVADHYSKTEADTLLAAKATNTALALKAPIASPSFTGNVGINTSSPETKLTIDSDISTTYSATGYAATLANSMLYLNNTNGGSNTASLINFRTGTGDGLVGFVAGSTNECDFVVATDGGSNGIERLRVSNAGIVTKPYQPSFNVMNSNNLSISGTVTLVFNTVRHNVGNHMVASTGIFTAPVAGRYLFTFKTLLYAFSTNEYLDFYTNVNNSVRNRYEMTGSGGDHTQFTYSEIVQLSANDTFKLTMSNRNSGNGYSMYNNENHFSGHLIG